jgi:ferredoxin
MQKLVVDWNLCDGNAVCTLEAPELLEMNEKDEFASLAGKTAELLKYRRLLETDVRWIDALATAAH